MNTLFKIMLLAGCIAFEACVIAQEEEITPHTEQSSSAQEPTLTQEAGKLGGQLHIAIRRGLQTAKETTKETFAKGEQAVKNGIRTVTNKLTSYNENNKASDDKQENSLTAKIQSFFTLDNLQARGNALVTYAKEHQLATVLALAVPFAFVTLYNYAKEYNNDMWIYKKLKNSSIIVKTILLGALSGVVFATPPLIESIKAALQ